MQKPISWETTDTAFPAGTTFGGYTVTTINSKAVVADFQKVGPSVRSITTGDLPPDDYTIVVQAIDGNEASLGAPANGSFSIAGTPTTVTIPLPTKVNV